VFVNRRSGHFKALVGSLHFRLLGGFKVQIALRAVPDDAFERRRAKSLLKLLALVPDHRLHEVRAGSAAGLARRDVVA
jgi:DNA-binding SARP family transcriptional activator